jgi:hypothetical protein
MTEGLITRFSSDNAIPVGVSLLAMAQCLSTLMLNLPPSSLASQLPQVSKARTIPVFTTNTVGAGLPAMRAV